MATYYVATTGSDSGTGSATAPWRTINHAMHSNLKPGDEVVVRPGTYNESISIDQDGSAAGYITLRSEVPGEALIRPPSGTWNTISINANYVAVDGFDIDGGNGDGIEGNNVHHVEVLNNTVHDSGESGIQFNWSEFMTIEGNETHNNATSGWFSGISIYQPRNITGDTTTPGYRTIVRNNVSHDNVTESGLHTDGNGIIIDDFQSTQTSGHPNYTYPTLVEGNLVYENGGKGIQVAWSDHVTVRNNTAYHNNQDPLNDGTWRGELSNVQSSNNTWVNNIGVADPRINSNNTAIDNNSYGGYTNTNTVWHNNITFDGTSGQASVRTDGGNPMPSAANGNKLGVDPAFVQPGVDFHLRPGSPAIDAGTGRFGLGAPDLDGDVRPSGTVDIGADETGESGAAGNDAPHGIALSSAIVSETAAAGTVVGQLSATDPNGDAVAFAISGDSRFAVNARGEVVVAQGANLAVHGDEVVPLTISANDGHGGATSTTINVTILDATAPSGTNLLANGSFEASAVPTGGYDSFASVPGWTAVSGGRIELWNAHRGVAAIDGADFAELDYAGARDGFYQDVNAAAGQSYTLSFDLRARPGQSASTQGVEVVWNDQVVATTTPGGRWSTFTTTVTGTAGQDRLTIREVGGQGSDGYGALLDDFSLVATGTAPTPTPPPPTTGQDTVTVGVSGDAYKGDPNFALTVNGRMVDSTNLVTADHGEGEWDTLVFKGDFNLDGTDRVGIQFTNDLYTRGVGDRNLYVDSVTVNGETNGRDQAFIRGDTAYWDF